MKDGKFIKIIRWLRQPFDYICHIETKGWQGKIGDAFAWLASGTDCRCCIGMRVAAAFVVGLIIGVMVT